MRAPLPGEWASRAACRGLAPTDGLTEHPFFAGKGKRIPAEARAACGACTVRPYCYAYALKYPVDGCWAGIPQRDWRELRKRKRRAS